MTGVESPYETRNKRLRLSSGSAKQCGSPVSKLTTGTGREGLIISPSKFRGPRLELKDQSDGAWWDGDLVDEGDLIRFHYLEFTNADDEVWNKDDMYKNAASVAAGILQNVRLRSTQLQDEQCPDIKSGTEVCAVSRLDNSCMYFDAVIQRVERTPHINNLCTCAFKVKWKAGPLQGQTSRVRCGDIALRRFDEKKLYRHPVLKALKALTEAGTSNEPKDIYKVETSGNLKLKLSVC